MLFGAPGVGKGTFAKMIQADFDFMHFSTGHYFRYVIKKAEAQGELDELQSQISKTLNAGRLVDDQVVVDIMKRLNDDADTFMEANYADSSGLILDGVPRTLK